MRKALELSNYSSFNEKKSLSIVVINKRMYNYFKSNKSSIRYYPSYSDIRCNEIPFHYKVYFHSKSLICLNEIKDIILNIIKDYYNIFSKKKNYYHIDKYNKYRKL